MLFKDKKTFINYAQIIPGIFVIIWIVMSDYIPYIAPKYPDELHGRVYPFDVKTGIAYLTLTEEILFWGSIILAFASMLILHLIANYYWKDED